eukprot:Skav205827  [mRNA]  locus=scaffold160:22675:30958:- [translate_table: standard]
MCWVNSFGNRSHSKRELHLRCPWWKQRGDWGVGQRWVAKVTGSPFARFAPWLVGGEVPRVDCRTDEGFQLALRYVAERVPVVMLNLDLMPATKKWDVEYLGRHCNEWPGMNVLRSDGTENRYLYYVPEQADRDMSAFQHAPRHASDDLRLSFESFLQRSKQELTGPVKCLMSISLMG